MGFLNVGGLADAQEPELIPDSRTHLRVANVHTYQKEDSGRTITRIIHKVEDERFPNAADIPYWMSYPMEGDSDNAVKIMTLNIKRYLTMAGVPFENNGFNEEDLYGAEFDANVVQQEDDAGVMRNNIILDRIASEG